MMGALGTLQISGKSPQNGVHSHVTGAIAQASTATGVDFDYLLQQASVESSLNPNAKARTSSATGLYQFIEQTWLRVLKTYGHEHGYGKYADAIRQNGNGDFVVGNRGMRNTILNLRKDPQAASLMAAELATENHNFLKQTVGGDISGTDLYLAHFLGAQGASNFLKSLKKNPWAPAASIFPDAARSNRGVFYANGKPLSLQAIYNRFDAKFTDTGTTVQTASAAPAMRNSGFVDVPQVVLPAANDWGRPGSPGTRSAWHAQQIATGTRDAGLMAFAAEEGGRTNSVSNRIGRGYLQSPVAVMELAQTNLPVLRHNDSGRYNS